MLFLDGKTQWFGSSLISRKTHIDIHWTGIVDAKDQQSKTKSCWVRLCIGSKRSWQHNVQICWNPAINTQLQICIDSIWRIFRGFPSCTHFLWSSFQYTFHSQQEWDHPADPDPDITRKPFTFGLWLPGSFRLSQTGKSGLESNGGNQPNLAYENWSLDSLQVLRTPHINPFLFCPSQVFPWHLHTSTVQ